MKTIYAKFNGCVVTQTDVAFQYDYGQILLFEDLDLPSAYEVHFSNERYGGETVTQIGDADGVTVPDALLQTGKPVYAFVFLHQEDDDGETEYVCTIPVAKRPEPSDETPDPVEQSAIDQAIAALQTAVAATADDVLETEENVRLTAGYAEDAETSADDAEAWAVGKRDGVPVDSDEPQYLNNSWYWAQLARQGAEHAGYAAFSVNQDDGEMYVNITNSLDEDVSFLVNENTGELEVMVI